MAVSSLNSDWTKNYGNQMVSFKTATPTVSQAVAATASRGGSSGGGGGSSYNQHLGYFGSPQAYADAINQKESVGMTLDDPAAAAAFKWDYPQYFGNSDNRPTDLLSQALQGTNMDMGSIFEQIKGYFPTVQMPPTLSFVEAQARAKGQLDPLYDDTLKKTLEAVDESNIRRGFFGQMPGAALSRSTAADIENRRIGAINSLANNLVGKSESDAKAQQQIALQQQQHQANLLMDAFKTAQQQKQNNISNLLAILNYRDGRDDKQYGRTYQAGRDAVSDEQWNKTFGLTQSKWDSSPEAQDWYLPLTKEGMQADIAAKNRSNTGGSTSKPTYTEKVNNSVADAYDAVDNALAAGHSADQVVANIQAQTANLVRQGVDPQKVIDYAYSRAGAYTQPAQDESWYTSLDRKLGGWLPGGIPR
ncbi:MAG: hypothetical protein ACOY4I_04775 [Bacillota bacterium]